MQYAIYDPDITTTTVIDPYSDPAGLTYVSNSSLVHWQGRFWAIMDGTTEGFTEGSTGQQIWLTTSVDGETWETAYQPFRDSDYCTNPVSGSTLEWQPNLVVAGDELWCTWSAADSFVSKLATPEGLWTNYRFEFDGTDIYLSTIVTGSATGGRALRPTVNGVSDWISFFSQNPVVLSSGVVACPLTLRSPSTLTSQITDASNFVRQVKHNALYRCDNDVWSMVLIDTSDFGDFCAWEPFVVENPVGHVYFYSRSLNMTSADPDFMLVAVSTDGGETFSPSVSTKLLVPSTRGYALKVGDRRWIMPHIDCPQGSDQTPSQTVSKNRINGALFVSRRGNDDFVPGVNFSGKDNRVNYPQCDVFDGHLYVNYTSQDGGVVRRSLKVVKVPLPADDIAYVHPRSVTLYNPEDPTDPALRAGTPPYYEFLGGNQMVSSTSLAASTGVSYAAWLRFDLSGEVVIDGRATGATNFGQVFRLRGLAINALNFLHTANAPLDTPVFLAAVVDNVALTVTLYMASGSGFTTTTGHYRSVLFAGQPSDGDTVTVDGITYTFRASASLDNDVQIGATSPTTAANLVTALQGDSFTVGRPGNGLRLLIARADVAAFTVSSGSAQITAETGIPLDGGPISIGRPAITSSLSPFSGELYQGHVYDTALSLANVTYLHNAMAADFGYDAIAGTSTNPGAPLVSVDPTNPNPAEFPPLGAAAYCEVVDADTFRIHGEASASAELAYGVSEVVIRYKLGATPTGSDKYVIASFGTVEAPLRLYIDAAGGLLANGGDVAAVADPTVYNTVTVRVFANKVVIGDFEQFFSGKARCYLGNAFPEGLLDAGKSIDYNITAMTVSPARRETA